MNSLESAKLNLQDLSARVKKGDIEGGKAALAKLKINMIDFPIEENGKSEYLEIARSGLEMGVLLAVADGDLAAFARNVTQIKAYYAFSPFSTDMKCKVLGLNLMYLLVENRLSEFHSELELLSEEEANNSFVSFPINLERQLMVGSYDEVLNASARVPDESYQFFMENLLQTVRDTIADCLEVAYKTMSVAEAMKMMRFENSQQFTEYIDGYRDDWILEGDNLCFQPPEGGCKASDIPSMKIIANSLSYATELERIV